MFRFLHTGDWHIGKGFGRFPAEVGSVLRQARLDAIDTLASAARTGGASVVLIAGDVFDSPGLADAVLLKLMARLQAHTGLRWFIIPGNHDPATPAGLWDRLARLDIPANVHVCRQAAPIELADGVVLLPSPLSSKAVTADPTAWMSDAGTAPGTIRIGLAHGATQGFGSEATASVPISPTRARDAGLDYLALGDWHGCKEIAPSTWYAGTPEPDSYQDNDPGHALLVTIPGSGASPTVQRCRTAAMTWLSRALTVSNAGDLDPVLAALTAAPDGIRILLELSLQGEVTLADDAALREFAARHIAPRIFHLATRFDGLRLAPASNDIEELPDAALRSIAADLVTATRSSGPQADVAGLALRRLYRFARDVGGAA